MIKSFDVDLTNLKRKDQEELQKRSDFEIFMRVAAGVNAMDKSTRQIEIDRVRAAVHKYEVCQFLIVPQLHDHQK